ncbi:MAG: signal peptidase II [Chloroflexi bacterium]|nr:signal peptidase II [Chloroflexota bacterium]
MKSDINSLEELPESGARDETVELEVQPKLAASDYAKSYLLLLILAGGILVLDQMTKNWVRTNIAQFDTWMPVDWLAPFARIVNVENTGAAFGIFKQGGGVFTVLAIIVSIVIIFYFPRIPNRDWFIKLPLGMQLGGALGNLFDRLVYGPVTDFIAVGTFPVFNVADSSIFVGTAILILGVWMAERKEKLAQQTDSVETHDLEIGEQA